MMPAIVIVKIVQWAKRIKKFIRWMNFPISAEPTDGEAGAWDTSELVAGREASFEGEWQSGCSSMVELQPSKLVVWVRFPSPAPKPE
jgi:hypothetical protein